MMARNEAQEAQIQELNQRINQNRNHDALLKIPDPIKVRRRRTIAERSNGQQNKTILLQ